MSSDACNNDSSTPSVNLEISYEVIFPLASYVALSFVLVISSLLVISRMLITVEITTKSELVLFNTSPQRHLEMLVSKHASSTGAMNNIHSAIALGLMIPPKNYVPPPPNASNHHAGVNKLANGGVNHHVAAATTAAVNATLNMDDEVVEAAPARPKKSKW